MDQTVKNMAMNILFRESLDSNKLLKDFFIVDAEGRRDGRFNMQNTIDYLSAYMPFEMYWSIRVKFEEFLDNVWSPGYVEPSIKVANDLEIKVS